MKQNTSHIILYFAAVISLLLSGCDEDVRPGLPIPSDVEILPKASLTATRALSGCVDGSTFPLDADSVFAVSAFLESPSGVYDTPYFLNQTLDTDSDGKICFSSQNGLRYYPEDESKLYFYAYSPVKVNTDDTNSKSVSWTLTGKEDIMCATDLSGIKKMPVSEQTEQKQPVFGFCHLLTRLNFRCRRETGFADKTYISYIAIKDQHTVATLDFSKFNASATPGDYFTLSGQTSLLKYPLPDPFPVEVAAGYNDVTSLMLPSAESFQIEIGLKNGLKIEFEINASDLTWDIDDPNHGSGDIDKSAFKSGCSYNVNMLFEGSRITFQTVAVFNWENGGSAEGILTPDN